VVLRKIERIVAAGGDGRVVLAVRPGGSEQLQGGLLRAYLEEMAERFRAEKVAVSARVCRGNPADGIARAAETTRTDLIVFGTHGKAGTSAFWVHSVGARVSARTAWPAMLVPVR
jgi:nucleotide-binding universal stress UspA family protein